MLGSSLVLRVLCLLSLSCACYIQNCPRGGKRASADPAIRQASSTEHALNTFTKPAMFTLMPICKSYRNSIKNVFAISVSLIILVRHLVLPSNLFASLCGYTFQTAAEKAEQEDDDYSLDYITLGRNALCV